MRKATRAIALAAVLVSYRAAQAAFTFDDITFWTGTGSNRAAMVITWSAPEVINPDKNGVPAPIATQTMVWGYRFDGVKNGEDMFNAIVAADPRLYAMVSGQTQYGKAVFGIGYDLDNDGGYGLTDTVVTYTPSNFTNGLVVGTYSDPDWFVPTDSEDLYWGGWYGPNWEMWHEQGGNGGFLSEPDRGSDPYASQAEGQYAWYQGQWEHAQAGMSGLTLENGSWMGWTVAAGGLEIEDPYSPSSLAWYHHKAAPAMVPEPASLGLLLTGAAGLLAGRRNRRVG